MISQPHITFHDVDASANAEEEVRRRLQWLERFYPKIMACRVSVELPHRRQQQGNEFLVKVDVSVPNREIIASAQHTDLLVAIRDAFRGARRELQDEIRLVRDTSM